jgi:hypothetical protein
VYYQPGCQRVILANVWPPAHHFVNYLDQFDLTSLTYIKVIFSYSHPVRVLSA